MAGKTIQEAGGQIDGGPLPTSQAITNAESFQSAVIKSSDPLARDMLSVLGGGAKTVQAEKRASLLAAETVAKDSKKQYSLAVQEIMRESQKDDSAKSKRLAEERINAAYQEFGRKTFDDEDAQIAFDSDYHDSVAVNASQLITKLEDGALTNDAIDNAVAKSEQYGSNLAVGMKVTTKDYVKDIDSMSKGNRITKEKNETAMTAVSIDAFQSLYKVDKATFINENKLKDENGNINWDNVKIVFERQFGAVATIDDKGEVHTKTYEGKDVINATSAAAIAKAWVPLLGGGTTDSYNAIYEDYQNTVGNIIKNTADGGTSQSTLKAELENQKKLEKDMRAENVIPLTTRQRNELKQQKTDIRNNIIRHNFVANNYISPTNTFNAANYKTNSNGDIMIEGVNNSGKVENIPISKEFIKKAKATYIQGLEGEVSKYKPTDPAFDKAIASLVMNSARVNSKPAMYQDVSDKMSGAVTISSTDDFILAYKTNMKLKENSIEAQTIYGSLLDNKLDTLYKESLRTDLTPVEKKDLIVNINNVLVSEALRRNADTKSGVNTASWNKGVEAYDENYANTQMTTITSSSIKVKAIYENADIGTEGQVKAYISSVSYASEGFIKTLAESFSYEGHTNTIMKMSTSGGKQIGEEMFISGIEQWLKEYNETHGINLDKESFRLDSDYNAKTKEVKLFVRIVRNGGSDYVATLSGDDIFELHTKTQLGGRSKSGTRRGNRPNPKTVETKQNGTQNRRGSRRGN